MSLTKNKEGKNGKFTSSVIIGHVYRDIVMLVVKRLPNISCYQLHRQNGQVFIFEPKKGADLSDIETAPQIFFSFRGRGEGWEVVIAAFILHPGRELTASSHS